ncbi:hypothetical protein [Staphylococcus pseudoxylosus]|uniref:hypothetical protein n=1 Tax=Staphylococcus pseudoxylosus TaxID=2282419 RepID=UPI002DBB0F69|nr:hypothetical protein [Staphylococcus pseudoxylosus]MEB6038191.1 hypothetical protein [Staphylococcus pseudoxylosus]
MYVNVYLVTREFGGHEEGGWYYDNYECVHSEFVEDEEKVEDIIEILTETYSEYKEGDISSINGGTDVQVLSEGTKAESETEEIPTYE